MGRVVACLVWLWWTEQQAVLLRAQFSNGLTRLLNALNQLGINLQPLLIRLEFLQ